MSFWKGKKVLVTGGSGFIGGHLLKALSELEANVVVTIHRTETNPIADLSKFQRPICDIREVLPVKHVFEREEPEIVFHLAAQSIVGEAARDQYGALTTNVVGSMNILEACRNFPPKAIVYISTDKVYGDAEVIQRDICLEGVAHPYNCGKLCGDSIAQLHIAFNGAPITIIRTGNVYGPGDLHFQRIVPGTIRRILNGENPVVRGDCTRDMIYVEDIVSAYLLAAERQYCESGGTVLNLGSPVSYHMDAVVTMLTEIAEKDGVSTLPIASAELEKGELINQHIDDLESNKLIDWEPIITLDEGLEECWRWYRKYLATSAKPNSP